jgi:hypothetical protein
MLEVIKKKIMSEVFKKRLCQRLHMTVEKVKTIDSLKN